MVPTPRLLLLLALALPFVALDQQGIAVVVAAGALSAAAADYRLAADASRLGVVREVADKLSLGAWSPVRLVLRNGTARHLRFRVRDLPPPEFRVAGGPDLGEGVQPGEVGPGEESRLDYRVYPPRRGDFDFGSLHVRIPGPLGLVWRSRQVPASNRRVRVYPNLRDLRRYDLMARRGLALEAGARAVRVAGASTEFERLREYGPDDEFRRINWKATARRDRLIVNQFEAERSQNLVIVLDAGRLMAAPAAEDEDANAALAQEEEVVGLTKLDYALNAALLLAYVATGRGDRVALLAYADDVRAYRPPARGRQAFLGMLRAFYNVRAEPVEPDHGRAFSFLAGRKLRRSLVVLFTDLADRESSSTLVAHLRQAARHHQVVCVTLADPTVARPARAIPRTVEALYAKAVAQRLQTDRAAVLGTLAQGGVMTLDTSANELSPRLVSAYLQIKQRGRI